jgi:8-oxo-dGTP pyrophosphatase MutT (NUDIX family)
MGKADAWIWSFDRSAKNRALGGKLDKTAIRDAATTILTRDIDGQAHVLMGQRGAKAAFMPNKFVFPGGAVDPGDGDITLHAPLNAPCRDRLTSQTHSTNAEALAVAAIRELWEEAGLILGHQKDWSETLPSDWETFAQRGYIPSAQGMSFVFRAITPPGRPRRFDARFFMIDAAEVVGDLDDFSAASDELSHLQWIAIEDAKGLDMPFITEVVLAEVAQNLKSGTPPDSVPFFKNDDEEALFLRLSS